MNFLSSEEKLSIYNDKVDFGNRCILATSIKNDQYIQDQIADEELMISKLISHDEYERYIQIKKEYEEAKLNYNSYRSYLLSKCTEIKNMMSSDSEYLRKTLVN